MADFILAITSHYVDSNFCLQEDLLDFQHIPQRHTGRNLAKHVYNILERYGLKYKLYCITTDNADNNSKMVEELSKMLCRKDNIHWDGPKHHIPCLAHVINLAVKDFLNALKVAKVNPQVDWRVFETKGPVKDKNDEIESNESEGDGDTGFMNLDQDKEGETDYSSEDEAIESDEIGEEISIAIAVKKLQMISRMANFPQTRILAFEQCCHSAQIDPRRPIRDQATRWSSTYYMMERAIYLRRAIELWTRSDAKYEHLILSDREWEMTEFLVQFLRPFSVITTIVQGTSHASLQETWVHYEAMFDVLDEAKETLKSLKKAPIWLAEVLIAIEAMWAKLRKYYDRTDRPFAYVDATLLHPGLKVRSMEKSGYSAELIEKYVKEAEARYIKFYDSPSHQAKMANRGKKRGRPNSDTDSSSDGDENDFTSYMARRREKGIQDPLPWWATSGKFYIKLGMMARDAYSVPPSSAGVEREFSISGRVITKQRNRLAPKTIQDIMQVKRWLARHGKFSKVVKNAEDLDTVDDSEDEDVNSGLKEWADRWERKQKLSDRARKIATM